MLQHVGYSVYHADGTIGDDVLDRLMRLWDWRASQLNAMAGRADGATASTDARAELETFGWWFASGVFEPKWALVRLSEVLRITGGVHLEHAAAERLAELAPAHPLLAVSCIRHVDFTGRDKPWTAQSWLEHLATVVQASTSSAESREVARESVNRVIAAGHTEYRTLLAGLDPV